MIAAVVYAFGWLVLALLAIGAAVDVAYWIVDGAPRVSSRAVAWYRSARSLPEPGDDAEHRARLACEHEAHRAELAAFDRALGLFTEDTKHAAMWAVAQRERWTPDDVARMIAARDAGRETPELRALNDAVRDEWVRTFEGKVVRVGRILPGAIQGDPIDPGAIRGVRVDTGYMRRTWTLTCQACGIPIPDGHGVLYVGFPYCDTCRDELS